MICLSLTSDSTLVLTTSSGYYVDVRIQLPPNFDGDLRFLNGDPDTLELDWAFAGTSLSTTSGSSRSCTWTHWIDTIYPYGHQDSGTMWELKDGTTLEIGSMENPATGKVEDYQEIWEDLRPTIDREQVGQAKFHARMLYKEGSKGMIINIGGWLQGIRIDGEGEGRNVTVERWCFVDHNEKCGDWKLMFKVGDGDMPIEFMMKGITDQVKVVWRDEWDEWKVVEHS